MEIGNFQPYFLPQSGVLQRKNLKKYFKPFSTKKNQEKNIFFLTGHFPRFPAVGAYDAPMPACSQNFTKCKKIKKYNKNMFFGL